MLQHLGTTHVSSYVKSNGHISKKDVNVWKVDVYQRGGRDCAGVFDVCKENEGGVGGAQVRKMY